MTISANLLAGLCKVANVPDAAQATSALNSEAVRNIIASGLLAAVGGAGLRAAVGSSYLFGTPRGPTPRAILPTQVRVPIPVYEDEEDQRKALGKAAEDGWWERLFGGQFATKPSEIPWYFPALAGGTIAGAAGGYGLADKLIDSKRKRDLSAEVDNARKEYEAALLENYTPQTIPLHNKVGCEVGMLLDQLAEMAGVTDETTTKEADGLGQMLGQGLGLYGAFAVPTTILTGYAAYQAAKARSNSDLLAKAIKQRERERFQRRPPEIVAVPEPVRVSRTGGVRMSPPELGVH